jgi:hypothetical protein
MRKTSDGVGATPSAVNGRRGFTAGEHGPRLVEQARIRREGRRRPAADGLGRRVPVQGLDAHALRRLERTVGHIAVPAVLPEQVDVVAAVLQRLRGRVRRDHGACGAGGRER